MPDSDAPLKVAMFCFGSRGDMQPMFALAAYLQRERNMKLLVFVPEKNDVFCNSLGLRFVSIWPSLEFGDDEGKDTPSELKRLYAKARAATAAGDTSGIFEVMAGVRAYGMSTAVPLVTKALRSFGADLFVASPLEANLADAMSLLFRVPVVSGCLQLAALTSQTKSMLGER